MVLSYSMVLSQREEARGKLQFDGTIEQISCITQHEDFISLSLAMLGHS